MAKGDEKPGRFKLQLLSVAWNQYDDCTLISVIEAAEVLVKGEPEGQGTVHSAERAIPLATLYVREHCKVLMPHKFMLPDMFRYFRPLDDMGRPIVAARDIPVKERQGTSGIEKPEEPSETAAWIYMQGGNDNEEGEDFVL